MIFRKKKLDPDVPLDAEYWMRELLACQKNLLAVTELAIVAINDPGVLPEGVSADLIDLALTLRAGVAQVEEFLV